jgi:tetrahydromethanopterin S-methyltransferase subunit G
LSDSMFKLQLLARSELALTQIRTRRAVSKSTYIAFSLVLFLLGIGMLNVAGFLALETANSALIIACANGIGGVIVLLLSQKAGPSENEERMAKEVREMAYRELNEDVNDVKNRLENLAQEVSNIGEDISRATGVLRFLLGLLKK